MHSTIRALRSTALLRPIYPSQLRSTISISSSQKVPTRQSSTRGGKPQVDPGVAKSRELEHPGPPPPDTSKPSQSPGAQHRGETPQQQQRKRERTTSYPDLERQPQKKVPSNKARPTLNDGRESPNIDDHGNVKSDVPDDVKQHNEELSQRYDRAYNQIADEGEVSKGFWKGSGGSLTGDKSGSRRDGGH